VVSLGLGVLINILDDRGYLEGESNDSWAGGARHFGRDIVYQDMEDIRRGWESESER